MIYFENNANDLKLIDVEKDHYAITAMLYYEKAELEF